MLEYYTQIIGYIIVKKFILHMVDEILLLLQWIKKSYQNRYDFFESNWWKGYKIESGWFKAKADDFLPSGFNFNDRLKSHFLLKIRIYRKL